MKKGKRIILTIVTVIAATFLLFNIFMFNATEQRLLNTWLINMILTKRT